MSQGTVRPLTIGNIVFLPVSRKFIGFHIDAVNVPGILSNIARVFYLRKINIVSIALSHAIEYGATVSIFIAVDITNIPVSVSELIDELRKIPDVIDVRIVEPFNGILVDEGLFPMEIHGTRVVLLGPANIIGLFVKAKEKFGPEIFNTFLYYAGFEVGRFAAEIYLKKLGIPKEELNLELILKVFGKILTGFGWCKLDIEYVDQTSAIVRLYDNWECIYQKGFARESASYYVRGCIAGFISAITGREVIIEEVKCVAKGDPYCEFHILLR